MIANVEKVRDLLFDIIDDEFYINKTMKSMVAKVDINRLDDLKENYGNYSNITISESSFFVNSSNVKCLMIRWIIL